MTSHLLFRTSAHLAIKWSHCHCHWRISEGISDNAFIAQMCTWETNSLLDDVPFLRYHLVATVESVILPVAVAMAWYKHELLLGAAAQVRKFHYLRMRSSKMTVKAGPAKTGPAAPLATAMQSATVNSCQKEEYNHVCYLNIATPCVQL